VYADAKASAFFALARVFMVPRTLWRHHQMRVPHNADIRRLPGYLSVSNCAPASPCARRGSWVHARIRLSSKDDALRPRWQFSYTLEVPQVSETPTQAWIISPPCRIRRLSNGQFCRCPNGPTWGSNRGKAGTIRTFLWGETIYWPSPCPLQIVRALILCPDLINWALGIGFPSNPQHNGC